MGEVSQSDYKDKNGNIVVDNLELPDLSRLQKELSPKLTKYIPHRPFPKQSAFLLLPHNEAFYGGAAGGGKSDALLMAALQYVDVPGYSAILFRRTYAELSLAGALMFRAKEWLNPYVEKGEVKWSEKDKMFTFPSGATLAFGYLESNKDKFRYQSAEFQFIGFDELTHFKRDQYTYLFNRLRRSKDMPVPLRMRAASNPGNEGHQWVKQRFLVEGPENGRIFIPATLEDNKYLDREEYEESLKELDPVTRAQLLKGDWEIDQEGEMFKEHWFEIADGSPSRARRVRYWDLAATDEGAPTGKDAAYTVGVRIAEKNGEYYIEDIRRAKLDPGDVERLVKQTAKLDGKNTIIRMEQEPGSAGKNTISHYRRNVLPEYDFDGDKVTGSKILRANPFSSAAKRGDIYLVQGSWNRDFLDEAKSFPEGQYKDQIDAASGAYSHISQARVAVVDPDAMKLLRGARLYA